MYLKVQSFTTVHTYAVKTTSLFRVNSHSVAGKLGSVNGQQKRAKDSSKSNKGPWLKIDTDWFSVQT